MLLVPDRSQIVEAIQESLSLPIEELQQDPEHFVQTLFTDRIQGRLLYGNRDPGVFCLLIKNPGGPIEIETIFFVKFEDGFDLEEIEQLIKERVTITGSTLQSTKKLFVSLIPFSDFTSDERNIGNICSLCEIIKGMFPSY